jgi:DnaJ-class molecular chaperone
MAVVACKLCHGDGVTRTVNSAQHYVVVACRHCNGSGVIYLASA